MALRFNTKAQPASTGANTFAHGLGTTPTEYWLNNRGVGASTFLGAGNMFSSAAAADQTNVYVYMAQTGLVDVFAAVPHSIIL